MIYALAHVTTHIEKALSKEDIIRTVGEELHKINLACVMAAYDDSKKLFITKYISLKSETVEQLENSVGFPLIGHAFPFEKMDLDAKSLAQATVIPNPEDGFQILFA